MYACSDAFHEAVRNENEQKALLIFDDCVFTDDDISVENGIVFNDYFNTDTDLAVGQALSNEISFTLFNDDRLLNSYKFGDFLATIGVFLESDTYTQQASVMIRTNNRNTYLGNETDPFFTRNGARMNVNFPVKSILAYANKVWAFGDNNQYFVCDDTTGADITSQNKLNSFMKYKVTTWAGKGIFYNRTSRHLLIYEAGTRKNYEFVPLGYFTAERPKAPDTIEIDMTCYDWMQKFDVDMPTKEKLGITYPTTIGNLFVKMCQHVGVSYISNVFINSTATIKSEPEDFKDVTMREVLKWIAEAAGSNARFNRDGKLELRWLKQTTQKYTADNFSEFNPYWYKTKKVTKLYNRDTQGSTEKTYGTGDVHYLVQDNPLLRGVT